MELQNLRLVTVGLQGTEHSANRDIRRSRRLAFFIATHSWFVEKKYRSHPAIKKRSDGSNTLAQLLKRSGKSRSTSSPPFHARNARLRNPMTSKAFDPNPFVAGSIVHVRNGKKAVEEKSTRRQDFMEGNAAFASLDGKSIGLVIAIFVDRRIASFSELPFRGSTGRSNTHTLVVTPSVCRLLRRTALQAYLTYYLTESC